MRADQHEPRAHADMQRIMMAVLVAMQEEQQRREAEAAEQGVQPS